MPSLGWTKAVAWMVAFAASVALIIGGQSFELAWLRSFGTATIAVTSLLYLFDRWAWRWPGIRRICPRPDIGGTWHIEQLSSAPQAPNPIRAYLVVDQTFSKVTVSALYEDSRSRSLTAELRCEDHQWILSYLFRSHAGMVARADNPPRLGAAMLTLGGWPLHIEGEYWTDRSTRGQLRSLAHDSRRARSFPEAERILSEGAGLASVKQGNPG